MTTKHTKSGKLRPISADFRRHVCQTSDDPIGIEIRRAKGAWVFDQAGRAYLDFMAGLGVNALGHAHPAVVRAIRKQAGRYLHAMVYGEYVQEPQVRLAARLAELLPSSLSTVYFTNSGTESVEGALKVAKKFTGRSELAAFERSYHGDTHGSLSVTGREVYQRPFRPLLSGVTFLAFGETADLSQITPKTAAVIVEPIQGEGGVRVPPPDFLSALRRRCDAVGALLIFDEVMTGFGRTGRLFAFEHWKVKPDILVMGKAIGGGMPLGGFAMSLKIARTLAVDPPFSHVTTFGGHPVSCAAGLAALEILVDRDLPSRAARLGDRLRGALLEIGDGLKETAGENPIREVRGRGLLVGMELSSAALTRRFVAACRKRRLILGWTLHSDTLIRMAPPLSIPIRDLDRGIGIVRASLSQSIRA